MTVPEQLYEAPLPVVAAYLRSLFQAEGYVSVRERAAVIGMDMISEGIIKGVQSPALPLRDLLPCPFQGGQSAGPERLLVALDQDAR